MPTPLPWGDEFLVNLTTADSQNYPSITTLADGRFVVAWTDYSASVGDRSGAAVRAQVFNSDGSVSIAEFVVNTTKSGYQMMPRIAAFDDGRFVIVWDDSSQTGGDRHGFAIRAQLFNANGSKQGTEFQVNTIWYHNQADSSITVLADGRFVITWSDYSGAENPSGPSVRAQMFNADGSAFGVEFRVGTGSVNTQSGCVVTALTDGRFVTTWHDMSSSDGTVASSDIYAKVFNADGSSSVAAFLVNSTTSDGQYDPDVTALAGGRFVVAWTDLSKTDGDISGYAIRAQLFNAEGSTSGTEFLVNTTTTNFQASPAIAELTDGRFVIAWTDGSLSGGDKTLHSVRAQVFNSDGSTSGLEFLVNSTTLGEQSLPTVTALDDGRFVVAWRDLSQSGGDTSNYAIRAQIFEADGTPEPTIPTAGEIFKSEGKLAFMAQLALTAYHHADWEHNIVLVNERNEYAEFAFVGGSTIDGNEFTPVNYNLKLLSSTELLGLQPVTNWSVDPDDSDGIDNSFPLNGLKDGIYTNENAGALVGRSADAIFLSFRGTNDNATGGGLTDTSTPDKKHWTAMGEHYALFEDLITAIKAYVVLVNTDESQTNDITTLYVTGHSLGAAMVQAFMEDWTKKEMTRGWAGISAEAVTFASPGYGDDDIFADNRIANFWNVRDQILWATWVGSNEGYDSFIEHNLVKGVNLNDRASIHSMALYNGFMQFFRVNGIDLDELNSADNVGKHFSSIYANVHVLNEGQQLFQIAIDADFLDGSRFDNLMLGGANDDVLSGNGGADRLLGGADWDKLYGGAGEDTLEGGYGYDELTGGAGRDRFIFNNVKETNSQGTGSRADLIKDFDSRFLLKDFIDLREIDANWGLSGNQAFDFIEGTGFGRIAGQLRFEQRGGETIIMGDTDGDGVQNFLIRLTGLHTMSDSYFFL